MLTIMDTRWFCQGTGASVVAMLQTALITSKFIIHVPMTGNDETAIVIVGFNRMKAGVSKKACFPESVRCDVTLKLAVPLETPAVIQIDVSGDSRIKGNGTAATTFPMLGRKQEINFHPMDDAGVQRFAAKFPKGAQQLDFSIGAAAHGEPPDSTAVISIDSLNIVFERK